MPSKHQQRVREMMEGFGQRTPDAPTDLDSEQRITRARLILEEALETVEALGVDVGLHGKQVEFAPLQFRLNNQYNLIDALDGAADTIVVSTGLFVDAGIDDEPIIEAVDKSNLSKVNGGHLDPDTGKYIKGDYEPVDIEANIKPIV